jgi:hypothetical protein
MRAVYRIARRLGEDDSAPSEKARDRISRVKSTRSEGTVPFVKPETRLALVGARSSRRSIMNAWSDRADQEFLQNSVTETSQSRQSTADRHENSLDRARAM